MPTPNATPEKDPYAPPPRYKESSGKLVRVMILAGVLGVAAAGYTFYADDIEQAQNEPMVAEEQQFAEAPPLPPADSQSAAPESNTLPPAAPSAGPAPAPAQSAPAPAPVTDAPLPPPSTTTDPAGESTGE